MSNSGNRQTKNEKREAAREKARQLREEQQKKEKRTKLLLQGGILVAVLAVVAVVALVIVNSVRPPSPGPLNMASDGVQVNAGKVVTPTPALQPGELPVANDAQEGKLDIRIYVDYLCPFCKLMEDTNGEYIESLVQNGAATLEVHPVAFLDRFSQGTKYATRAANAVACVVNYSPANFYDFHMSLFENQPAENTRGLDNGTLWQLASESGVTDAAVQSCINNREFEGWVTDASARAANGPLLGTELPAVTGTPTTLINGVQYPGHPGDAAAFRAFVVQSEAAATPQPEPTPTPSS